MRTPVRRAGYVLTASAAVVAFLAGVNVPQDFWVKEHSWTLVVAAVWIGGAALAGSLNREHLETGARAELRVMDVIKTTLVQCARLSSLELTQVTVRVYVVRRPLVLLGARALKCVASVTLRIRPPQRSNVIWTRGTGIVGICWQKAETGTIELLGADTREISDAASQLSAEQWAALSTTQQGGLSQEDAKRLNYYGVVVAYPMCDAEQKFRGCLVVEGPAGKLSELTSDDIADYLYDQQRLVWRTLVAGDRQ